MSARPVSRCEARNSAESWKPEVVRDAASASRSDDVSSGDD
jgi:hypothetical protein